MTQKFPDGRTTDDIYREKRFFGLRNVMKGISEKLRLEFKDSSVIGHSGDMGEERELFLKNFLNLGHFPKKYSISKGHGKVNSSLGRVSLQTDLVLYDGHNCPVLRDGENHQFFPVESVYAVIQVKSRLSKTEFLNAAENIASVKKIAEEKYVTKRFTQYGGGGMAVGVQNSIPFGAIFAYSLDNNSLKSLSENMAEYHAKTNFKEWVNLVCVLDQGVIYNMFGPNRVLDSRDIIKNQGLPYQPNAHETGSDALLDFYLAMLGALGMLDLVTPPLHRYVDLPIATDSGHSYKVGYDSGEMCAKNCDEHGLYELILKEEWIKKIADFLATSPQKYPASVYLAKEFGQTEAMKGTGFDLDKFMPDAFVYTENGLDPLPLLQAKLENGRLARQYLKLEFDGHTVFIPRHFFDNPDNMFEDCPNC